MFSKAEGKLRESLQSTFHLTQNESDTLSSSSTTTTLTTNASNTYLFDLSHPESLLLSAVGMNEKSHHHRTSQSTSNQSNLLSSASMVEKEQVTPWTKFIFNIYKGLLGLSFCFYISQIVLILSFGK